MYNAKLSSKSMSRLYNKIRWYEEKTNIENFCYSDECREDFKQIPFR